MRHIKENQKNYKQFIRKFVFGQSNRHWGQNISINYVYYTDKLWGCLLLINRLVII